MLSQLNLTNFKCFEKLRLPLARLTLLSGSNASGKSSVLQALVLLHQTMRDHEWSIRLMLNGPVIKLGTVSDVVDKIHGRRSFEIGVVDNETTCHWVFQGDRQDMSMEVKSVEVGSKLFESPQKLRYLLPPAVLELQDLAEKESITKRLRELTYITAERLGPREVYSLKDRQSATVVGPFGEDAVSVLYWGMDSKVIEELALPNVPNTRLRQVEERMRILFPGCGMFVQQVPNTNVVTLGLRNSEATDFHRPIHVGFGLTQVLPIFVAALSAMRGDILIIENPEVHLHPAGQALMGGFLADVARAGIQVILETHSDHVLNGIRRAVKTCRLTFDQVAIHFFRPRTPDASQVDSLILDDMGNIDAWPEGFFDQFDKDMNYFAGWGK